VSPPSRAKRTPSSAAFDVDLDFDLAQPHDDSSGSVEEQRFSAAQSTYQTFSGITYAATNSNEFFLYGPLLSFIVYEYPVPSLNIVDFTCTRTNFAHSGFAAKCFL